MPEREAVTGGPVIALQYAFLVASERARFAELRADVIARGRQQLS